MEWTPYFLFGLKKDPETAPNGEGPANPEHAIFQQGRGKKDTGQWPKREEGMAPGARDILSGRNPTVALCRPLRSVAHVRWDLVPGTSSMPGGEGEPSKTRDFGGRYARIGPT